MQKNVDLSKGIRVGNTRDGSNWHQIDVKISSFADT